MAIAVQMDYTVDLCKPAHLIQMDVPFFTGDKNAHRFHVKLVRNGCEIAASGLTATGYMVRADQHTVVWDGEVDGCDIYLTMPASCYAVAGRFRLLLRVTQGDVIETALWVEGTVRDSTTEAVVDPGEVVPSLEELLAQIEAMEAATDSATTATDNAKTATAAANAAALEAEVSLTGRIAQVEDTCVVGKYRPELVVGSLWNTSNGAMVITNNGKRARTVKPIRGVSGMEARLVQTDSATAGALYNVVVMYVDNTTGAITVGAWKTLPTPMQSGLIYHFSFRDKNNLASAEQIAADIESGAVYLEVVVPERERLNHGENAVRSIAHRGDAVNAPENTMSAFRQAVRSGYRYMESDVHFTSDGIPVMLHDDTIDRTSNGSGNVSDYTLAQLRELDFGSWKSDMYAGEKIPTFVEMLAFCRSTGIIPFIELKGQTQEQTELLVDYVDAHGLLDKAHWVSFDATRLEYVRGVYADANLCHVQRTTTASSASTVAGWKTGKNEVGILCYNNATETSAEICRAAGVYMMALADTAADVLSAPTYVTWYTVDGVNAAQVLYDNAMSV